MKVMVCPFVGDGIRANVLRDAARFSGCHPTLANRIHQRSLAVIDVPHESDDRGSRLQLFLRLDHRPRRLFHDHRSRVDSSPFLPFFDFKNVAVLFANRRCDIRFDRVVDRREDVHVHQIVNQLKRLQPNLLSEIPNDDRRLDVNCLIVKDRDRGVHRQRPVPVQLESVEPVGRLERQVPAPSSGSAAEFSK